MVGVVMLGLVSSVLAKRFAGKKNDLHVSYVKWDAEPYFSPS